MPALRAGSSLIPQPSYMSDLNILIVGGGGREHALAWRLEQSSRVRKIFIAPGNGGTQTQKTTNISIGAGDFEGLKKFALENDVSDIHWQSFLRTDRPHKIR
jgi:hypothetical protein